MNRKSIYFEHYFHGEHDINQLLKLYYPGTNWDNMPHIHVEIDSNTTQNLIDLGLTDLTTFHKAVQDKWNLELEQVDATTNILELSYPEDLDLDHFKNSLIHMAGNLMDNAGGDDDFYDYTPGTVESIAYLLEKLGYEESAQSLIDQLNERGHYD